MSEHLDIATLPLIGRRLIEASAGTGKTFTLAALYVRLILGHGGSDCAFPRPLMPPEILVVTFTEAATEELRERIRLRLRQARDALLGRETVDVVLERLLAEVEPEHRLIQASRLDGAARVMDDAAIFTIHGFCQRMLKRHAFDSGTLFAAELTNETERLFETLVEDYWRCHFYPLEPEQQGMLLDYWESPAALARSLQALLHGGRPQPLIWNEQSIEAPGTLAEALLPLTRAHQRLDEQAERVRQLWYSSGEEITTLLRDAIEQGRLAANRFKGDELAERLDRLAQWCARGESLLESGLLVSGQPWCGQQRLKAATKKRADTPEHAFFSALDALAEARQALPEVQPYILAHARDTVSAALEQEKRRRGLWDFDDLLNGLDVALSGPAGERLAGRIRRELPVAMIDEFQDTDPVQYRIFSSIYPAVPVDDMATTLLMIGDPKQAIYGFRGADIHTYLAARRDVTAHYTLATNFRSTEAMVSAVNRFFGQCSAPFLLDEIPFEPVAAQGRQQRLVGEYGEEPALSCWLMSGEVSVGRETYARCMAEATRADIQRLLTGGLDGTTGFCDDRGHFEPLRPSDLAVLVRTGREAELVREALARGGIRSVYLSQKSSVFQSPEAFHLLQLLEAVAQPDNDRRLRAALATRLLSDSLDTVAELEVDELAWETMVERFGEYHRLWQRDGVLPMLRAVMRHFDIGKRLIIRDEGERALTDLLHLGELAQAASVHLDGEQALLRWLHQALSGRFEAGLDPESLIQRLESDETLVRVITIHKSKGLEYAVVYLPFACDYREIDGRATHFRLHDDERGRATVMAPTTAQRQQADRERLAEDLRLLYVAMTRARYACRLGIAPLYKGARKKEAPEGATTLLRSAFGSLMNGHTDKSLEAGHLRALLEKLSDGDVITLSPPPQPASESLPGSVENREITPARRFTGRIDRNWWIASYTALMSGAHLQEGDEETESFGAMDEQPGIDLEVLAERNPVPLPSARRLIDFPRGPRAGTFLHGLFEQIDFGQLATLDDPNSTHRRALAGLITARLARRGFEPHWRDILLSWIAQVLPAPLHPAIPGLSLAYPGHWRIELEFWLPARHADSQRLDALVRQHEYLPVPRPILPERELTGMLKGYIDLLFEYNGRYYLLDWKSNHLGDLPEHYDESAMLGAIGAHRYDLQYVLYTLALHRLLRTRLAEYDYDDHCGGVFYAFVRGMDGAGDGRGVLYRRPARELIETLDRWLEGDVSGREAGGIDTFYTEREP
ncbi:exodeoxyribonuclease V subunit beta [Kushneria phosphatilytica]|uniref:RecBCD enzyme subunit RecB n=1 Tax=Kushneria phosphatilytica TaxID=657387 RepID=A0A1S1P108_9GAMM|nr:exodeoxyribonuclease V subunit beta [Kushneria phosphatilytica]OHV12165.1 exodeoxyribonuclease V subunit beta [Kushneria phosphatilytica]QEL11358.1 exodeoxyribonuclease V subunit beta [Kushneria phosphatilytica]